MYHIPLKVDAARAGRQQVESDWHGDCLGKIVGWSTVQEDGGWLWICLPLFFSQRQIKAKSSRRGDVWVFYCHASSPERNYIGSKRGWTNPDAWWLLFGCPLVICQILAQSSGQWTRCTNILLNPEKNNMPPLLESKDPNLIFRDDIVLEMFKWGLLKEKTRPFFHIFM